MSVTSSAYAIELLFDRLFNSPLKKLLRIVGPNTLTWETPYKRVAGDDKTLWAIDSTPV